MDTLLDMRKLDPDDTRPPYVQVAAALRAEIGAGTFGPGQKLPTHQELVSLYGVSLGTVKRALGELQGAGVLVSRQGQGAFVRSSPPESIAADGPSLVELAATVSALSDRIDALERRLAVR